MLPFFSPIGRIGSDRFLCQRGFDHRPVDTLPTPGNAFHLIVFGHIFNHYHENISLEEVAEELGMQPTYFSKFFRQATGRRFVEFVNSLRITRACDLLVHSDLPITNICFEVGFTNISNFNRHFMALKEMTPSSYRKLAGVACLPDSYGDTATK